MNNSKIPPNDPQRLNPREQSDADHKPGHQQGGSDPHPGQQHGGQEQRPGGQHGGEKPGHQGGQRS
jgi:hypothetical protein